MYSKLTDEELQSILDLGKEKLLKLVPYEHNRNSHAFNNILNENFHWYRVIKALSECCTNSKKRADKFEWDYNLTLKYLAELWIDQNGRCDATGIIMSPDSGYVDDKNPYKISTDRIHNCGGYTKGNVRLLTHWANNAKSTWPKPIFDEFINSSKQRLTETV